MATLLTKHGLKILVDDDTYSWASKNKWCLTNGYPSRRVGGRLGKLAYLHRIVMNNPKLDIDHINGNKLDCRRSNLRMCTESENLANRGKQINNTSGYKGVTEYKEKWIAQLQVNKKKVLYKEFKTKQEAALAYNKVAIKYLGKFAYLNNIGGTIG